jgi:hypothetical protein
VIGLIASNRGWPDLRRRPARGHLLGLGVIALLALWLTRRFMFSSAFPAGTDMLGFVSRAQDNASWDQIFSLWSPSSFGAPRQFTLDNVLGFLTLLTGDPLLTVKLLVLGTLFGSGGFAYLLAWRWYGDRQIALLAGVLYMTSQASISRWASGQLNIEIVIAAAPLLVYLWVECMERFTIRRALVFSLAATGVMLVRLDMILYFLPFLALFVVVRAAVTPTPADRWRNLAASLRVIAPAMIVLNLYQLIPLLAGVRASWLSSAHLFDLSNLVDRSLGAYDSLLGFGREIGYLGFTGQQTWFSHPWVSLPVYFVAASITVGLAYSAVWRRTDARTLFLVATALLATFLAKGVRDPLGGPYLWAFDHVPGFGNLRGPNRWLILQALAYSTLAAVGAAYLLQKLATRRQLPAERRRTIIATAVAGALACLVLPVAPTLLSGFRTWHPDSGQVALLERVARDRDRFRVATVPYDQSARFLDQGSYHGYEHDLGVESSLWTKHPVVGDGGWNQRASDFVAFTSSLLRSRDPAFAELLGSVGVKYLLKFNYSPTSPHLIDPAQPFYQQRAVSGMPGLKHIARTDRGDLYALASRSPIVSFRPNLALVLGGSAGLAALADYPRIDLKNWAAVTADDALERGGLSGLLKLVREANLVLVSNERVDDLAVLATKPFVRATGITNGSEPDRKTQLVPSDASIRAGSMADKSAAPPKASTSSSSARFTVRGIPRQLELWARVKTGPTAGRLTFTIDGKTIRELVPLAVEARGFRWIEIDSVKFGPGVHRVGVTGSRSSFGRAFDVDEAKVIDPVDRETALAKLKQALTSARAKLAYALDVDDLQKWGQEPDYFASGQTLGGNTADFWRVTEPEAVKTTPASGSLGVSLDRPRQRYTFIRHNFFKAQNWRNRPYMALKYRGTGSGRNYFFIIDFGSSKRSSAAYPFVDTSGTWRTQAFSLRTPIWTKGRQDWSHVTSIRMASDSRAASNDVLELGTLRISKLQSSIDVRYPVQASPAQRPAILTSPRNDFSRRLARIPALSTELDATLPFSALGQGFRLIVSTTKPVSERPAPAVRFERASPTSYRFSFDSSSAGVLMLGEGYDPEWRLTSKSGDEPLPAFGAVNGLFLGPGSHTGSISFTGQRFAPLGIVLSLLSLIAIFVLVFLRRREEPQETEAVFPNTGSPNGHIGAPVKPKRLLQVAVVSLIVMSLSPLAGILLLLVATLFLRPRWWMPWLCGMALLMITPVVVALGIDVAVDDLAFAFVVFMTIGLALLIRDVRSRQVVSAPAVPAPPERVPASVGSSF